MLNGRALSMTMKGWFTEPNAVFAKRNNLFLVKFEFANFSLKEDREVLESESQKVQHIAKSVSLPSFSITEGIKEKIPIGGTELLIEGGFVDWQPITLTFNDIMERPQFGDEKPPAFLERIVGDLPEKGRFQSFYSTLLYAIERALGRSAIYQGATAMDPKRFARKIPTVTIETIDEYGVKLEAWILKKPWITELKSPELTYENSDIREFSVTLDYIVAEYIAYDADGTKIFGRNLFRHRTAGSPRNPFSIGLKS